MSFSFRAHKTNNNNNEEYTPILGQNEDSSNDDYGHSHVDFGHHCIIRTMILQLALSFHSIMEGMAIGKSKFLLIILQQDGAYTQQETVSFSNLNSESLKLC